MRDNKTIAFIGPDGQCAAEALVAAAWNLPMITHVIRNYAFFLAATFMYFLRIGCLVHLKRRNLFDSLSRRYVVVVLPWKTLKRTMADSWVKEKKNRLEGTKKTISNASMHGCRSAYIIRKYVSVL